MTDFIGKHFVSKKGASELAALRIGGAPAETPGDAPIQLLARVPSEECGCPEELWSFDGVLLLFHLEEDSNSDAFIFAGDWDMETTLKAKNLDDLRAKAFQWYSDIINSQSQTG